MDIAHILNQLGLVDTKSLIKVIQAVLDYREYSIYDADNLPYMPKLISCNYSPETGEIVASYDNGIELVSSYNSDVFYRAYTMGDDEPGEEFRTLEELINHLASKPF